jgi:hypothetical protein
MKGESLRGVWNSCPKIYCYQSDYTGQVGRSNPSEDLSWNQIVFSFNSVWQPFYRS